jgi:acetyl-CoA carboxylase carboxyl transferase subunit alpha
MENYLEFEQPIMEISARIRELAALQAAGKTGAEKNIPAEIERLELKKARVTRLVYRNLKAWQKVQIARHPDRPQPPDYIAYMMEDFQPLAGDRAFADDPALVGGVGRFQGQPVMILGTDKGKKTKGKVAKNFGMPKPEGYRKARRLMQLADKFQLPLITFVDTPGAFPGVEAEARGQGEAIAACIEALLQVNVPVISIVTGEGGSGGALALATADKVFMLEHSVYSVISPEGCAAILWREANKQTVPEAAKQLKLTAQKLERQQLIDGIIKEPVGAAHRDPGLTLKRVGQALKKALGEAKKNPPTAQSRREKFIALTRAPL